MSINMKLDIKIIIIFLLITFYFIYEAYRIKNYWNKKKLIFWITVRTMIIVLLFLSISNFNVSIKNIDTSTIFLIDESLSTEKYKKDIENYLNCQIGKKSKKDKIAVIGFGKEPVIEVPLTYEKNHIELGSKINKNFTNLEKAMDFAISYFPKNNNRRLVIITDKRENCGDIYNIKEKIKKENINLVLKEVKNEVENDVQITDIMIPENIYENGNIPVKIKIDSTSEDRGDIYLYLNDKKILTKKVNVKKGSNEFHFTIPIKNESEIILKGEMNFLKDINKFNNISTVYRDIRKDPKILVISENTKDAENINKLMDNLNIKRTNYISKEVPNDINFLCDFSEIILINSDYKSLPQKFDETLEKSVDKFGTGLLVIGGENSFALGGYEKTTLEKILPVNCKMKNNRKQANTGLVLLLDCSGSMNDESGGIKKIELAKQAAIEAINALEQEDYVGVLAFSDTLEWVVPFQKVNDKKKIVEDVGKLKSKGGTLIIPGLIESMKTLESASTKVKHMIFLTDGQAEKSGFDKYINEMKKNKITASTVAVGNDCDKEVLAHIADSSGGRKYVSKDFLSVPQILSKETYISQKKYINNESFTPKQLDDVFNKKRIALPKLNGYMGTGIKQGANLTLQSEKGDPIFAHWSYGLGKIAVWTSDMNGKWSGNWIAWDGVTKYWASPINYLLNDKEGKEINLQLKRNGGNVELLVSTNKNIKNEQVEVLVACPGNTEGKLNIDSISEGQFSGTFELNEIGKYSFLVILRDGDKVIDKSVKSVYLDYSPEHNITNEKYNSLDEIMMEFEGKYLNSNANVFKQNIDNKNISYISLDFILLPIVFLLFLIDILLRIN
ncbi:VWA domain-containing protein [Clostridium tetanomorphum]|uniref:VWA domain-containing protein n=1 Tax=Clostridium tetanomorphum TaxID=1553 RepID=A0A923EC64_CLOTT|nr:VWA domain-containing protein [Clostridium tetanomorphum]MBC2397730.1 VWA domain-containing protein [Clostridium tetanomorphum]NRZ96517.1 Mg-chelatase subunit ChlD [Clostridium tetanomorphum]